MLWQSHVEILQEISVGVGYGMHISFSLIASQGRIYTVMWTRIFVQADSSVWIVRRVRTMARKERVMADQ